MEGEDTVVTEEDNEIKTKSIESVKEESAEQPEPEHNVSDVEVPDDQNMQDVPQVPDIPDNDIGGSIAESSTLIPEQSCEDIMKTVMDTPMSEKRGGAAQDGHSQTSHEPECPLYEDPEKVGTVFAVEKHQLPTGEWCTCGVCPRDVLGAQGDEKDKDETSAGADGGLDGSKGGASAAGSTTDASTSDVSGMADWDYSDSSSYWDDDDYDGGEGRGRHKKKKKKKGKKDKKTSEGIGGKGYYVSPMGSERSRHEGSFVEDYMKFFVEPLEVCYKTLSSISPSFISCEETGLQRTIVIVKPQAVQFKEVIYRVLFESGFQILGVRVLHLTPEQVSEIYAKHYGSPSFVHLVVSVSEAPLLAICITAMNVISQWLKLIGPQGCLQAEWFFPFTMRKLFGLQPMHPDWLHGSENLKESNKENRYFYPNAIIEPIQEDIQKVTDYCQLNLNKAIIEACAEVVKKRPADPIIFFADYLLQNNPFQPRLPGNIAFTPT